MRLHAEHVLDCSAEELWDLTFSSDFDVASNLAANGMASHETIAIERTPQLWTLRSRSIPATKMPKFVQRWVDDKVHFDTTVEHVPGSNTADAKMVVSLGAEYVTMGYRMTVEPITATTCKRIFDWEITVYGVGSLVERFILGEIKPGVEKSAQFTSDYVARRRGRESGTVQSLGSSLDDGTSDGRLRRPAAEINLTEHCNLKCAGCNHASHLLPKRFVALDTVKRDLEKLATVMLLDELKLVGGEPLLHPELLPILRIARASGVARQLTLVTNGVLLHKMPDEVFWLIDRLWVSRYPGVKVQFDLAALQKKCAQHDVVLWHKETNEFQLSLINRRIDDDAVVAEVFSQCAYAHVWSCHTIYEGRYFKCSPAPFVPARLALQHQTLPNAEGDSVDLHAPADRDALRAALDQYLASKQPLAACHHCLGHLGRDEASRQLNKAGLAAELTTDHRDLAQLFHPERRPAALKLVP